MNEQEIDSIRNAIAEVDKLRSELRNWESAVDFECRYINAIADTGNVRVNVKRSFKFQELKERAIANLKVDLKLAEISLDSLYGRSI